MLQNIALMLGACVLISGIFLGQAPIVLAQGQGKYIVLFETSPTIPSHTLRRLGLRNCYTLSDSNQITPLQKRFLATIQNAGYLEATSHSLHQHKDTIHIKIQNNAIYTWKKLRKGNLFEPKISQFFSKKWLFQNQPFRWAEVLAVKQHILAIAENEGYPFATIQIDSLHIENNQVSAAWHLALGKAFYVDTFRIEGNARLKARFLKRYLRLYPDQLFSQKRIQQAQKSLQQLPFISLTKPLAIRFEQNLAQPYLFLQQRKINQFDGILGLLPNEERQNSLLLTGELNIRLFNLFAQGISLRAEWQRLQTSSQNLNIQYEHPVLIGSVIDAAANLQLLKQDSTFLNVERRLALFYRFANNNRLSVEANLRTSRVGRRLSPAELANNTLANTDFIATGLGYQWNRTDDIFYPQQGTKANFIGYIGNKRLIPTTLLPDSLLTTQQNTTQIIVKAEVEYFAKLKAKRVLYAKGQVGTILNQNLFINDLFRIGGLNSLRGHNQNAFFASNYAIFTLEYRLFTTPESYLFAFYDQAYYYNGIRSIQQTDYPLGLGVGASFSTKAGIFNIAYALGQAKEHEFSFNRSKIHFGLVSRF